LRRFPGSKSSARRGLGAETREIPVRHSNDFQILQSDAEGKASVTALPDAAVCPDCLKESSTLSTGVTGIPSPIAPIAAPGSPSCWACPTTASAPRCGFSPCVELVVRSTKTLPTAVSRATGGVSFLWSTVGFVGFRGARSFDERTCTPRRSRGSSTGEGFWLLKAWEAFNCFVWRGTLKRSLCSASANAGKPNPSRLCFPISRRSRLSVSLGKTKAVLLAHRPLPSCY